MANVINNIFWLIAISFAYLALFALIPFWLRGYRLSGENVLDNLVSTLLYSHVIIILTVLLLSLAGIYYRITLILTLIIIAVGYRCLFKRKQTIETLKNLKQDINNFTEGYYHLRIIIKNLLRKPKFFLTSLISKIKNPVGLLFTIAIFGFAAYHKIYNAIDSMPFVTTSSIDVYTHTEWIKYLMHNTPFYNGVYPYGYHAVIAALSDVFGINVITVIRMFGTISGMMIIFSLYYILIRTMKSAFALNVTMALYVVTDLYSFHATWRTIMALPQEYATIFLYFSGYFLYKYMKEKEVKYLISFSAAVSLIFSTHIYVLIFAFFLCVAVFVCCLVYINRKTLSRLVIGVLCGIIISMLPFVAGVLSGIPLEGSVAWAITYITEGSDEITERINLETGEKIVAVKYDSFSDFLKEYTDPSGYGKAKYISWLNMQWFLPYLIGAVLALITPVFLFRKKERLLIFSAFSIYTLTLLSLYIMAVLEIFVLTEDYRIYMFLIYSVPLVICMPLELIYEMVNKTKKSARSVYLALMVVLASTGISYMVYDNRFMPLEKTFKMQHDGAVLAYYDIVKDYPKNNWTIISPIFEYTLCLFEGYHYELTEFIIDMDNFGEDVEVISLPTEYVFLFVEKRPIAWYKYQQNLLEFDEDGVYFDLRESYKDLKGWQMSRLYENYEVHCALNAKAYAWANEYKKYFPDEMTVFYEDDEIIVYRIRQNPYALNNFAIPYKGNTEIR